MLTFKTKKSLFYKILYFNYLSSEVIENSCLNHERQN